MAAAQQQDFHTAVRAFASALGAVPCDESTAYNAACCYALSGDTDNAVAWIKNAARYVLMASGARHPRYRGQASSLVPVCSIVVCARCTQIRVPQA